MVVNEYKNVIIDKYTEYDEDARLISDRGHNVEYLTTMRYIQKFLKPGDKILEIGAATGRYSIALAKMGYEVTAVDLVPKHVEIMKSKTRRLKNFKCMVADALDLSQFEDNSFDVVLNFGPMYHLFNKKIKTARLRKHYGLPPKTEFVCLLICRARLLLPATVCAINASNICARRWMIPAELRILRKRCLLVFTLRTSKSCLSEPTPNILRMWQLTECRTLCGNGWNN